MLKLFYKSGACSLAPHILLNELHYNYDLEEVDFKTKTTEHGRDYFTVNPKGLVPALELKGGSVLTENAVILQYLADLKPKYDFLAPKGLKRYRCLELVNFIATEIHKGFGPLFHLTEYAQSDEARKRLVISSRKMLQEKINFLAEKLGDKDFLMGTKITIADIYFFVMLTWCPHMEININQWENLPNYLMRIKERPAVKKAMKEEHLL